MAKHAQPGFQLHVRPRLGRQLLEDDGADAVQRAGQVGEGLLARGAALLYIYMYIIIVCV